jgi:hypothetical protein
MNDNIDNIISTMTHDINEIKKVKSNHHKHVLDIYDKVLKRSKFDIQHNPDNIWKIILAMTHEIQESIKIDNMYHLPRRIKEPFKIQLNSTSENIFISRLHQHNLITKHTCDSDDVHGPHKMYQISMDVFMKDSNIKDIPIEGYQLQIDNIKHVHIHLKGFPCLSPECHNNWFSSGLLYRLDNIYYCPISNSIHICNIGSCRTNVTRDGRICVVSGFVIDTIYDVEELWSDDFSKNRDWIPNSSDLNIDQQKKEGVLFNTITEGSIDNIRKVKLDIDNVSQNTINKCSKQSQFRSVSIHFYKWKNGSSDSNQLDTIKSTQLDSMAGMDRFKQDSDVQKQELMPFTQNIINTVRDIKNGYNNLLNVAGKVVFDILFSKRRMEYVYNNNEAILCEVSERIYKYLVKHMKERKPVCIMNVLNVYNEGLLNLDSYATRIKKMTQETMDNLVTYYAACVLQVYINIATRTPDGFMLSYNFTYYETFVAILFLMKKVYSINVVALAENVTKQPLNDIYFKLQIDENITIIPSDEFIQCALPNLKFLDFMNINYGTISNIQNNIITALSESLNTYKISPYMLEVPSLDVNVVMSGNTGYHNIIEALIVRRCQQIVACARFIKESESIMLWDRSNFDLSIPIDKRNIIKEIMKCNSPKDNLPVDYILNCRKVVGPFGPPSIFMRLNVVKDKIVALRETSILNVPKGIEMSPLYQAAQKYLNSKPHINKLIGEQPSSTQSLKRKRGDPNHITLKEARDMIRPQSSSSSSLLPSPQINTVIDTAPWL